MSKSMYGKKIKPFRYVILSVVMLLLFLWQSTPRLLPEILGVTPIFMLPLLASVGVMAGEYASGLFGFFIGLLMDVYVTPSICFNLIAMTVIGILCGLLARALKFKSFFSALVLCVISSVIYYLAYWLVYRVILSGDTAYYLLSYSLPALIYTTLTIIPIFFIVKLILNNKG